LATGPLKDVQAPLVLRDVDGGVLVQDRDRNNADTDFREVRVMTKRAPTPEELADLRFAWVVCKHVKSNAIVLGKGGMVVGVGAGQMSRVDSVNTAALKAQLPLAGSVVASDAFFPFPDGLEQAVRHGATAFIQPGGSVKDLEVIAAADRLGAAMVFTGVRHFRH
jgi:phosphoribosylaminoimidazolecarboxamide formyltransferase/IMP cyclohydrolase